MSKKDHQALIDILIDNDLNTLEQAEGQDWIRTILTHGFVGYANMSTKELRQEAKERDILRGAL
jgi:hypothetical protein